MELAFPDTMERSVQVLFARKAQRIDVAPCCLEGCAHQQILQRDATRPPSEAPSVVRSAQTHGWALPNPVFATMVASSFHLRFLSLSSRTPLHCDWWETASLTLGRSTVGDILRSDKDSPSYLLIAVGLVKNEPLQCIEQIMAEIVVFHCASDHMEHLIQIA